MMNIGNLGSKESIRDKFKEGQIVLFNFKMKFHQISGFIANVQKESSKQSLPKKHFRGSRTHTFFKKGVLRHYTVFIGKYLCWSLFLTKFQALRLTTLFKRDFSTGAFQWIMRNFYKKLFLLNTSNGCFCQFDKLFSNGHLCRSFLLIKTLMWDDGFY